jgi:hypothetical protein
VEILLVIHVLLVRHVLNVMLPGEAWLLHHYRLNRDVMYLLMRCNPLVEGLNRDVSHRGLHVMLSLLMVEICLVSDCLDMGVLLDQDGELRLWSHVNLLLNRNMACLNWCLNMVLHAGASVLRFLLILLLILHYNIFKIIRTI